MDCLTMLAQAADSAGSSAGGDTIVPIETFWKHITSLGQLEAFMFVSFGVVWLFYGWGIQGLGGYQLRAVGPGSGYGGNEQGPGREQPVRWRGHRDACAVDSLRSVDAMGGQPAGRAGRGDIHGGNMVCRGSERGLYLGGCPYRYGRRRDDFFYRFSSGGDTLYEHGRRGIGADRGNGSLVPLRLYRSKNGTRCDASEMGFARCAYGSDAGGPYRSAQVCKGFEGVGDMTLDRACSARSAKNCIRPRSCGLSAS